MNRTPKNVLLQYLRKLVPEPDTFAVSDRELLQRFSQLRDETAFTLLVRRHGSMILRLCQRLLQNAHDAEDICQATFLVLAAKAASRYWQPSVASWLYRVAYHLARKAKAAAVRRTTYERQVVRRRIPDLLETITGRELLSVLDDELHRLPEKYRAPLVLCYLEGATRDQAARQLACPVGTLKHRVERARELLRIRLVQRGVTLSAALSTGALVENSVNAQLSEVLWERILQGALAFTGTESGMLGTISVPAVDLAEKTLKSMALTRLKLTVFLLLAVSVIAGGAGAMAHRARWTEHASVQDQGAKKQLSAQSTPTNGETENPRLTDRHGDLLPEGAVMRIGTTRLRTQRSITAVAFSQDSHKLAYGSGDGHAYVCQAADGKPLFEVHPDNIPWRPVTELAFSPDGQTLAASGYWSEFVWLFDMATRKVRHAIPNTAEGQNHWAREWQGASFCFTPDGRTLVVGGKDGGLHLWDTATGTEQAALPGEKGLITSLTLTADGRIALTAQSGGALHLWDVVNRKHLRKLLATAKYPHFTALAPDGKTVALASGVTQLELWDPNGGRRHEIQTAAVVAGLGFTPGGASLQVADGNGNIVTWDVLTGQKQKSLICGGISMMEPDARMGPEPSAWFRADGKVMAWSSFGTLRTWDLSTGQETPRLGLYRQGMVWAGFSPDGQLLRAGGRSGELASWDAHTGRPHGLPCQTDLVPDPRVWGPHYIPSPNRERVAVITAVSHIATKPKPGQGRIFLWDPAGDGAPALLREQVAPAWRATLTPDNRFVVAAEATGQIRVYDTASGKPTRSFAGRKQEYQLAFSPDGTVLGTTAADWTIHLYDFATGGVLRELKGLSPVTCLAFAPDGRSLASGHLSLPLPPRGQAPEPGDLIYVWDAASGRELRRIPTGHHDVRAVSFSPDGRLIASCGSDSLVHLWEASSGQERRRYEGHRGLVNSVDFAPDGRRLASASHDGTALVWQVFDPPSTKRSAADLDALWTDLAKDGITAHRAIPALIAAKGSVALLRTRVKPAIKPSDDQLKTWLADLCSPVFKAREMAQQEIARMGELAEPAVRGALKSVTDPEAQRRLTDLLERIPRSETRLEELRDLRAVEVLEYINDAESRRLLGELAKGTPEARLTREVKEALTRLSKRLDPSR